ncbi:MAG: radical SAM protein [Treponema sp.]|nr:MAG: radical SAM protein [Treponema sp.]
MSDLLYEHCLICPKKCGVNRKTGSVGACGETSTLRIAWAGLHFGEEPPISVTGGSGTIFITGCNLGCKFCQNFQISQKGMGKEISTSDFASLCLRLQTAGAENINIVTGSHATPKLAEALQQAINTGLKIPIVWNSSAYELPETIELLNGIVSIWLPDLKTLNTKIACNIFRDTHYPQIAKNAILKMCKHSQLEFKKTNTGENKMTSGVIVRHLALPARIDDSKSVLKWFAENLKTKALLSLMTQYTPVEKNDSSKKIRLFENRLLSKHEDAALRKILTELKIDNGFYQMLEPDYSWLPDFNRAQTFSSELSKPIWHWKYGFIK